MRGHYPFSRREFVKLSAVMGGLAALGVIPEISLAGNPIGKKLHGLSSFGDLKYGSDISHFDYANPDAPKGGEFRFSPSYWYFNQNAQTFNTLNSFVLLGEAPPRMELCFDTLMTWAIDEPDTLYCSLASSIEISEDRNNYRFELRSEARFHDGSPVTAKDVVYSYMTLKEHGHPQLSIDLVELEEAIPISDHIVELRFSGKQSDRIILSVANSVPILSKASFQEVSFENSVLETLIGSGPWKVGKYSSGSFIEYDRVEEYWGKDLFFAKGLDHFDTIRIDFFRERIAAFESFKKGETRWREEFTSKVWAKEYNFPAVQSGDVKTVEIPGEKRPSLQGWAINSRRGKFTDARTRQAIGMVFDFEWTNKKLFYGAYTRSHSIFEKSNFVAKSLPSPDEMQLLEPFREALPESVYGEPVRQYVSNGNGSDQKPLREAIKLLRAAGWEREGNVYVNEMGVKLEIEFLIRSQVFERILGPYVENLKKIGIPATIRLADPSQFQARIESFDFDMVGLAFSFGTTPTKEAIKQYFHSDSAARNGSNNYPGIQLAALDALIEQIDKVKSRIELETVMKAIDRVLRAHHFWIPNWYSPNHRIAMWDMFGWDEPKPDYFFPVERLWWMDKQKAEALEKRLKG